MERESAGIIAEVAGIIAEVAGIGSWRRVFPDVAFVVMATAAVALLGIPLSGDGIAGLRFTDGSFMSGLSGWGAELLGVWMMAAVVVGVLLPLIALLIWGRNAGVRWALLPYVLVLGYQIVARCIFRSFSLLASWF